MAEVQDLNLEEIPLYKERMKRAEEDKPPSRATGIGAVANARFPGVSSRKALADKINARDSKLEIGHFGTVHYLPVQVAGIDLKLEPVQPSIGTVVHGIDLAVDIENPEVVAFLRDLWLERRVIMFRDQQHLTRQQLANYARKFGELGAPFGEREHMPNSPHDINQSLKDPDLPEMLILPSDEKVPNAASGWHCDATWQPKPPMGSILMCREAPPIGGDTCFCDCFAMWEGLPLDTKKRIENLSAIHIGNVGHQMDGITPQAVHPVLRTHPETGQTSLYVQQGFVRRFVDADHIPVEEQQTLLLRLKMQEGRVEYTCRFRWEPGSIAMWDNRAVLHTASADFWPHNRLLERLTILDPVKEHRAPFYDPDYDPAVSRPSN